MVLVGHADGLQALRIAQDLRPVDGVSQHGGVRVCCLRDGWGCDPQRGDGEHRNGLPHDLFLIRCEMDASASGRAVLTDGPRYAPSRSHVILLTIRAPPLVQFYDAA
jgi:hypothetical protein